MRWHLPLFSAGVLAVMLLQQVISWSVKGQALVLVLEAIPGAVVTAPSAKKAHTSSMHFPSQAPHLSARLLQVSRVMSGAVGQT